MLSSANLPLPIQRRLALRFGRRPCRIRLEVPIVSFTFDDFPRSALLTGGAILSDRGHAGTYYVSLGLMGTTAPTGKMFVREDLENLVQQNHELACHTFDHCHSWNTEPVEFEKSILRNQKTVEKLLPGTCFRNLSYPISHPRPDTKKRTGRHYDCARGGGQTFNTGVTDLNYLKAFFIEQSRDNFASIQQTIDNNARAKGWLIFATHDVCDSPTRFGCTPQLFERVVYQSAKSGAAILSVQSALSSNGIGKIRASTALNSNF
jgi:peptidoglycan/xylan/chitin deacetylase (PgdA/CDA1 family)